MNEIGNSGAFPHSAVTDEDQDRLLELCFQISIEGSDEDIDEEKNSGYAFKTYEQILRALNDKDATFINMIIDNLSDQFLQDPDSKTEVFEKFINELKRLNKEYILSQVTKVANNVNTILH